MTKPIKLAFAFAATLVILNLHALEAMASEKADTSSSEVAVIDDQNYEPVEQLDETQMQESFPSKTAEAHTMIGGFTGYRFLSIDGYGGRASKYNYLHSGIIGGAAYNRLTQVVKVSLEGNYLSDNDYYGDLNLDIAGDYRFHLRTETLYHNTQGEKLFTDPFKLGRADLPGGLADYIPHQDISLTTYGVRTEQDLAALRYKTHDFPLHVNLGYWRMVKEGAGQVRFADIAFEGAQNDFFARSRHINRATHEGRVGFDTHLGPIDVIYNFQIRQFNNNTEPLRDLFAARSDISGTVARMGGLQEHNQDPDSRYVSHTVKLHTSLAGGLVGAASYTYGKRDNLSRSSDTTGADQTSANLNNFAGDLVYTPYKKLSLGVKYRRQEVATDNPTTITNRLFLGTALAVRPSISTEKDLIQATFLYRPINLLTIKGEYKGEFLHRDLDHSTDETLNWFINENQDTHKGTISAIARPVKGLRIAARYAYSTTDHPSYGTSFAQKHEGEVTTNYNVSGKVGLTASYRNIRELNDEIKRRTISSLSPVDYNQFPNLLSRDRTSRNFTTGVWFSPLQRLTVTANYGFLQNHIDQGVMFSITGNGSLAASDYKSSSHLYSLSSSYQFTDACDFALTLQEVHSLSEFKPQDLIFSNGNDTSGITELARSKTVETSFSARGNYMITKQISCAVEYTLQDYYNKYDSHFDGTVHSIVAYVNAKW